MIEAVVKAIGFGTLLLAVSFTFGWAVGAALANMHSFDLHDVWGDEED